MENSNTNALIAVINDVWTLKLCSTRILRFTLECKLTLGDLYTGRKIVIIVVVGGVVVVSPYIIQLSELLYR